MPRNSTETGLHVHVHVRERLRERASNRALYSRRKLATRYNARLREGAA